MITKRETMKAYFIPATGWCWAYQTLLERLRDLSRTNDAPFLSLSTIPNDDSASSQQSRRAQSFSPFSYKSWFKYVNWTTIDLFDSADEARWCSPVGVRIMNAIWTKIGITHDVGGYMDTRQGGGMRISQNWSEHFWQNQVIRAQCAMINETWRVWMKCSLYHNPSLHKIFFLRKMIEHFCLVLD